MKKNSFEIIFPEQNSYKKVNENRKICSETIFIENFSYDDFVRNLGGICEDFVRISGFFWPWNYFPGCENYFKFLKINFEI